MWAESKIKFKIIKTRVNARLSFKYLYSNGLANNATSSLKIESMDLYSYLLASSSSTLYHIFLGLRALKSISALFSRVVVKSLP